MSIKFKNKIKLFFIKLAAQRIQKNKFKIEKLDKVLIRINDPIGDAILTTPVYRELHNVNKNLQIDLILSKRNYQLFKNNPYINKIFILDKGKILLNELLYMRQRKYDLVIDLYGKISFLFFLQLHFINAKYYIANATSVADMKKYKVSTKDFNFFDHVFGKNLDMHHADRYLDFFNLLNYNIVNKYYEINIDKNSLEKFDKFFQEKKYIVGINYKGSNKGNSLTIETITELGKLLSKHFQNVTFILLSEPKYMNEARDICKKINKSNFVLTPKTNSLDEFISVIYFLDTIITTGSSAMHIASSFNKNIIAIYPNIQYYYTFEPRTKGRSIIINTESKTDTSKVNIESVLNALKKIIQESKDIENN